MIKFLRHLFFPHESNSHRAKLIHADSLVVTIALLFFSFSIFSALHVSHPEVLGVSYEITPGELLNKTNQVRKEHNIGDLRLDPELTQAAANKAADMFAKDYWAHVAPDGVTPWVFIKNSGYDYLYAGENLARGYTRSGDVVSAWMASPTHRDNMLSSNYTDVGFAVATGILSGSDTVLVVEEFGSRYSTSNESEKVSIIDAQITPALEVPATAGSAGGVGGSGAGKKNNSVKEVASIQQEPLVDSNNLTRNIVIGLIGLFLVVLVTDIIVVERKKIVRVVAHNVDHIFYLLIILLTLIVIGRGIVL